MRIEWGVPQTESEAEEYLIDTARKYGFESPVVTQAVLEHGGKLSQRELRKFMAAGARHEFGRRHTSERNNHAEGASSAATGSHTAANRAAATEQSPDTRRSAERGTSRQEEIDAARARIRAYRAKLAQEEASESPRPEEHDRPAPPRIHSARRNDPQELPPDTERLIRPRVTPNTTAAQAERITDPVLAANVAAMESDAVRNIIINEAVGGKAGAIVLGGIRYNCASVNGQADKENGIISAFGNLQDLDPEIVGRGEEFTLRIAAMGHDVTTNQIVLDKRIVNLYFKDKKYDVLDLEAEEPTDRVARKLFESARQYNAQVSEQRFDRDSFRRLRQDAALVRGASTVFPRPTFTPYPKAPEPVRVDPGLRQRIDAYRARNPVAARLAPTPAAPSVATSRRAHDARQERPTFTPREEHEAQRRQATFAPRVGRPGDRIPQLSAADLRFEGRVEALPLAEVEGPDTVRRGKDQLAQLHAAIAERRGIIPRPLESGSARKDLEDGRHRQDRVVDLRDWNTFAAIDGSTGSTDGAKAADIGADSFAQAGMEFKTTWQEKPISLAYAKTEIRDAIKDANARIAAEAEGAYAAFSGFWTIPVENMSDTTGLSRELEGDDVSIVLGAVVADARLYHYDGKTGRVTQLSKDESHIEAMFDAGLLDRDKPVPPELPNAGMITNVLGTGGVLNDRNLIAIPVKQGDGIFVCSDGVMSHKGEGISAEKLEELFAEYGQDAKAIAEAAIAASKTHDDKSGVAVVF